MCKAQVTGNVFLLKFVGTLKKRWNEVLSCFVEGLNNSIRKILFGLCSDAEILKNSGSEYLWNMGFPVNLRWTQKNTDCYGIRGGHLK
jgi:hypothetical protein